jgi:hypothetical protein
MKKDYEKTLVQSDASKSVAPEKGRKKTMPRHSNPALAGYRAQAPDGARGQAIQFTSPPATPDEGDAE